MEKKGARIREYVEGYAQSLLEMCRKFKRVKTYARNTVANFLEYVKDIRNSKDEYVRSMAADGLEQSMWHPQSYMRQVFQYETGICLGGYAQTKLVIDLLESGMRMDRIRKKASKAKEYDGDKWHHYLDDKSKGKARNLARWIDTEILDFREKGQRVILGTLLEYMNYKYELDGKLKTEVKEAYRYHKTCYDYLVNGYYVCKTAYDYACYLNSRKHLEDVIEWQRECQKVTMKSRSNTRNQEVA